MFMRSTRILRKAAQTAEAAAEQAVAGKTTKSNRFSPGKGFFAQGGNYFFGLILATPVTYIYLIPTVYKLFFSSSDQTDPANHTSGSSYIADMRQARRNSLKEFNEAYWQKEDNREYPAVSYDRFNKNLKLSKQNSHNPNAKDAKPNMKKKKSVGLYDSEGLVDKTRTVEGNEWLQERKVTTNLAAGPATV